jgi:hypothetical protein
MTLTTHNLIKSIKSLNKEQFMENHVSELLNCYLKYQHIGKLLLAVPYIKFNENLISMILGNFMMHDQRKTRKLDGF